ncbi:MAG: PKD domain-containing protein [Flavobacteriales bacterium]|nr:PKD domain-containing protein [Flavobacteriales bacterium]
MRTPISILFIVSVCLMASGTALAQYQANNNAVQTSCNCYQLTSAANGQNGSVWNVNLIDLNNPFNYSFDVFLGCNDGGADGMAFVLQPLNVNAGSSGGGIGYAGISPSLAVEMDTYQNNTDPSYDHMALQTNGVVTHGGGNTLAGPIQTSATTGNVEDCGWHLLQVSWNPATQTFQVWFDGSLRLTYTGNIINVFGGNPMVYWGFTAATGGANNQHQFCNALNPSFNITPATQCAGLPVQFNSTSVVSTGQINGYIWDFGDGNNAAGNNPSHTYTTAGTYTATLNITSEGCTASSSTQVTINPIPVADVGVDVSICLGDGVQVTPPNQDPTATYLWTPSTGVGNPNVPNPMLQPQTTTLYVMTVTSAQGCQASDDINITVNPLPVASAGGDMSTCVDEPVTLSGGGGVAYSWSPSADLATPNLASTVANPPTSTIYTLTVTDANNCSASDDVTVTVNPLPIVSAGLDAAICIGESYQLFASGANNYEWTPATHLSGSLIPNPVFSGPASTSLTLLGRDNNGCVNTASVFITVNPLPNVSAGADAGICIGDAIGLTATGAQDYAWSPSANLDDANVAQPTFSGNATTTLNVTGTDANGCVNTDAVIVTVHPLPIVNAGADDEVCLGLSLPMNASGAATYVWTPNTDLNNPNIGNPVFAGLADATFTVTGTDVNGCVDTDDISITVLPLPIVNAGNDAAICAQQTIQLGATGAVGYAWSPATGLSSANVQNPILTGSSTTTFTITGTDANGCVNTDAVTITVHPLPQAVIDPIAPVCVGNASFFSESSVGNVVDYAWTLGNGSASSSPAHSITYTSAQTYNVTLNVTDDNGCQHQTTAQAVVNPLPVVTMAITDAPDFCENEVISFQNTSPGQAAGISWNFAYLPGLPVQPGYSSPQNNPQFAYPSFGQYTVRLLVLSDLGCVNSATQTVNIFATPVADFDFTVACEGGPTAFTDLTTVSGTSVVNGWQWNYGDQTPVAYPQNPNHTFAQDGTYPVELIVQSNQGCRDTMVHQVWVNPTPVISISGTDVCHGVETQFTNGSIPQDGTIVNWDWDFGNGQTANGQTATHTYALHGNYTASLTAETDSGCTATGTTLVKAFPNPEPSFTVLSPEGCEPHTTSFFNNSVIASGGLAGYTWQFGTGDGSTDALSTYTYRDTLGSFTVTLTAISNLGCETTVVQDDAVTVHVTPVAVFSQSDQVISLLEPQVNFTDLSTDAVTYDWDFGNGGTSSQQHPLTMYMEPGEYAIELIVVNGMCSDTAQSKILVNPILTLYIPSAFTPDANGVNEVFMGYGEGYSDYRMWIYDRWGKLLFESGNDQTGWDGTYNGQGVQKGVYIYHFLLHDRFGREREYHGGVTLYR